MIENLRFASVKMRRKSNEFHYERYRAAEASILGRFVGAIMLMLH
jgi:hypothetical protein